MVLNEFHITQRNTVTESHRHTITGHYAAVSVAVVNATRTASG
ncbi:Uncharacterised protein [Vibrio cholerae]|nr:Uncharacterised protein [Vibrio cholerae]